MCAITLTAASLSPTHTAPLKRNLLDHCEVNLEANARRIGPMSPPDACIMNEGLEKEAKVGVRGGKSQEAAESNTHESPPSPPLPPLAGLMAIHKRFSINLFPGGCDYRVSRVLFIM